MVSKASKNSAMRAHIISRKDGWAIKKEGNSRASKIFDNKKSALELGEKLRLTGLDVVVHRKDGSIEDWKSALK